LRNNPQDLTICRLIKESQNLFHCYIAETTPAMTTATANTATPFNSYMTTGNFLSARVTCTFQEFIWIGCTSKFPKNVGLPTLESVW